MTDLRMIDPDLQRCWLDERPCHDHCKAYDHATDDCRILRMGEDVTDLMADFIETISKFAKPARPKRKRSSKSRKPDGMDKSKGRG
jgi:hypothetical protein